MSNDENKNINFDNNLISTMDMIDEPLIIVLDEDDYDEYENFDSITTTTTSSNCTEERTIVSNELLEKEEQTKIEVTNIVESNIKSKVFSHSSKSSNHSEKSLRTIVIDTSFVQKTTKHRPRTKSISKRKNISTSNNVSVNSVLSCISFDKVSNILTVSRMGSIYYCVEDLYHKIFLSLCTLDEFVNLLIVPKILIVKEVTLSEKLYIVQQSPKLKRYNQLRYRLIPIDSSDYLIKLKQLLLINKNDKNIEKIIDKMSKYKQPSSSLLLHDKVSTKRISTDDKPIQTDPPNVEIFIECNSSVNCSIYSKNTTTNIPLDKLTESSLIKSEIYSSREISFQRLYRSKSLIYNKEQINKRLSRSYSLPSIKFNIEENNMLKYRSKIPNSIGLIDDHYSMPTIVNVEENVQFNNRKIKSPEQTPSYSQSLNNTDSSVSFPYPYSYQSSSFYLTPVQTPYNRYYEKSYPSESSYQKSDESFSNHYDIQPKHSSPIIMSILERPISYNTLRSEQETSTKPCYLPDQYSLSKDICPNERMIYRQYASRTSPSSINEKQHRVRLAPYSLAKTYFAPLSNRHPSPQNFSINEPTYKTNIHYQNYPISLQNSSTTNHLGFPYTCTESINLSKAIIEHNHCDMDKIPKLVVRHTKTYVTKTIDTMGQLFPTWFNQPDYRCIHCFSCDQVFTPQLFMTHVDDKQFINEQPLHMSSIQLLTSEKMSEYKVELWNQFCTNLTIYAREGRIGGFLSDKDF